MGSGAVGDAPSNGASDYRSKKEYDLMSLKDRVIVVTGGARGIGLALAFAVSEAGASVATIEASAEPDKDFHLLQANGTRARYYR
jgi:sorbose reductase